jgi:MFS family permease
MAHQRQASASLAHQRNASGHLRQRHGSDSFRTDDFKPARRSIADRRSSRPDGSYIADDDHQEFHDGPVREEDEERDDYEDDWKVAAAENGSLPKSKKHMRQMSTSTAFEQRPNSLSRQRSDPRAPTLATVSHGEISTPPPAPTWMNMPNKGQLAILAASRFVDFFQMAALQTYMVHQLRSFDPELSDGTISHQAGMLQGAFTAAQIITSILWGRAADQPSVGRKLVLNIGLVGTAFGCIGVAFSTTFAQAVFWRVVSGAINGTVGSARTMVAERTPKPWHPRAFLLLPAAFNVANVAGPILSGILSEPLENFPHLFAEGSTFGGPDGVKWMKKYPYALPNLLCTVLLLAEAVLVHYGLDETLKGKRRFEPIRFLRETYANFKDAKAHGYRRLQEVQREGLLSTSERNGSLELERLHSNGEKADSTPIVQRLAFKRIWTPNVLWTLLSIAIFDFHMGAFSNLWILFLATPREFVPENAPADYRPSQRSAFKFASGLAFPPPTIGFAMAIIGFIGVALQFLLYPWANARFGLMRCFRGSLILFPAAYYLAPYIALLPSTSRAPDPASGAAVWLGISFVLFLQVAARTFALPATIILLNNSSPHPSVLGTIHGLGQACSATFRTLGPILAGWWFGVWMERGVVGMAWWIVGTVAAVGCVAAYWVRNGSGHEIFLPGEEQEEKEMEAQGGSGNGR